MDRPILYPFVRELAELERLQAYVQALPAHARVSEPVLPLVLAALAETLARPLVCLFPDDAGVIAGGILPAAIEMMDAVTIEAAEAAVSAGYPKGCGAVLIVEL